MWHRYVKVQVFLTRFADGSQASSSVQKLSIATVSSAPDGTVKLLNRRDEFQSPGRNGHGSGKNVADYAFCATSVTSFQRENA